jgi:hypothetical protein
MKFLIAYRRPLMLTAFMLLVAVIILPLAGCGVPAWLSDASSIITLVGASVASIASFVAGLTGNTALAAALAVVSTWITKVQSGIEDLQTLITQYQASPSTGLLATIESALTDVQQNLATDFSNLGLPTSVLSVIGGIAGLASNLLAQWSAAITGIKTATTSEEFREATARLTTLADALPTAQTDFRNAVNALLSSSTGDPEVDAALAKATRI